MIVKYNVALAAAGSRSSLLDIGRWTKSTVCMDIAADRVRGQILIVNIDKFHTLEDRRSLLPVLFSPVAFFSRA
jgi:hypothetical protein